MFVERLACIQFERSDKRFKSAHATNFLVNRLQRKYSVVNSCNIGLHALANMLPGWKHAGPYMHVSYSPPPEIIFDGEYLANTQEQVHPPPDSPPPTHTYRARLFN